MTRVKDLVHRVRQFVAQPTTEMTRAQRSARYAIELTQYSARTLRKHRAPQMAAALTYRTIFSLVPTLVLALLIAKPLGAFDYFGDKLQVQAYEYFGLTALTGQGAQANELRQSAGTVAGNIASHMGFTFTPPASPPPAHQANEGVELRQTIDSVIDDVTTRMGKVSFQSIGAVGVAILFWAAIALVVALEQCFNIIYEAPSGRSWRSRIFIYWFIITAGPMLVLISLAVTVSLRQSIADLPVIGVITKLIKPFAALGVSWLGLTCLYAFLPATKVRFRQAMIGAFVAAVLWEVSKWGLTFYIQNILISSKEGGQGLMRLYGSLFLIPLFMFWLYINWLVVLFGLEMTYTLQTLPDFQRRKRQRQEERKIPGDPMWLIPLMTRIGQAFEQGNTIDRAALAEALNLPVRVVTELASRLEDKGFIHELQRDDDAAGGYTLAMPPRKIAMSHLLDIARAMRMTTDAKASDPGWAYLDQLHDTQRSAADTTTLATLLEDSSPGPNAP
jgi:membrane protein